MVLIGCLNGCLRQINSKSHHFGITTHWTDKMVKDSNLECGWIISPFHWPSSSWSLSAWHWLVKSMLSTQRVFCPQVKNLRICCKINDTTKPQLQSMTWPLYHIMTLLLEVCRCQILVGYHPQEMDASAQSWVVLRSTCSSDIIILCRAPSTIHIPYQRHCCPCCGARVKEHPLQRADCHCVPPSTPLCGLSDTEDFIRYASGKAGGGSAVTEATMRAGYERPQKWRQFLLCNDEEDRCYRGLCQFGTTWGSCRPCLLW